MRARVRRLARGIWWLVWHTSTYGYARDICYVVVGLLALTRTPNSLQEIGVLGAASFVWASMIFGGAVGLVYGTARRDLAVEIIGCAFVGGGFLIWAVAAVWQPNSSVTSWTVATVFLSCSAAQLYRAGMLREGRVLR